MARFICLHSVRKAAFSSLVRQRNFLLTAKPLLGTGSSLHPFLHNSYTTNTMNPAHQDEDAMTPAQVEVWLATIDLEDLMEDLAAEPVVGMTPSRKVEVDAKIVDVDCTVIWLHSLGDKSQTQYMTILRKFVNLYLEETRGYDEEGIKKIISRIVFDFINGMHNAGSKTSVVWSAYSVVCTYLKIILGVDLMKQNYENKRLLAQWRKKETVKQSSVFGKGDFDRYLTDHHLELEHLTKKVIAILGTHGLCRMCELVALTRRSIRLIAAGEVYEVTIGRVKQKTGRTIFTFLVTDAMYRDILRRYLVLYDARLSADARVGAANGVTIDSRLFMYISKEGALQNKPLGVNAIGKTPKLVATALGLATPEDFTGHCWRRTGATVLANSGCSLIQLKQSGGWSSSTTAEGYVAESSHSKHGIAESFAPAGDSGHMNKRTKVETDGAAPVAPVVYNFGVTINMSGSSNCCPNVVLPTSFLPTETQAKEHLAIMPAEECVASEAVCASEGAGKEEEKKL
jgi:integrase